MSNKEELAALMASDGDYEKKISLLKKAVVTVTKQKQEIENRQTQLQEELRTSTQHLMEAQRENTALQRKVKTLEAQLEQERGSGGSAFGQNMLKGLSSIMGNNDSNNSGRGRGGGAGGRGRGGGGGGAQLSLSAEDVERLVTENEQLHREKYTYKTKLEDAQRTGAKDAEALRAEVEQLRTELAGLHGTVDTVTSRCDRLNADYLAERAVGDFCRHFFFTALRRSGDKEIGQSSQGGDNGMPVVAELRWPAVTRRLTSSSTPPSPPPLAASSSTASTVPTEMREAVVCMLQGSCGAVKTLLRGISVLIVVLREQLPRRERATVGDLECLRDRLSVFLDAHTIKKDRLMYLLEQLESYLATVLARGSVADASGEALTAETLVEAQEEVLQLFLEWVGLLRAQTPLLVESCVSYLPQGRTYTLHTTGSTSGNGGGSAAPPRTTTDRAEFVEEVTKYGYATLASVEGSLAAARGLVQRSPTAYRNGTGSEAHHRGSADDGNEVEDEREAEAGLGAGSPVMDACALLALQQFWWEGCTAIRALHVSAGVLDGGVQDLAEACNKSEVRDALQYLSKCLRTLAASTSDAADLREADAAMEAVRPETRWPPSSRGLSGSNAVVGATVQQLPPPSPSRGTVAVGGRDSRAPPLTPASAEAYEEVLVALTAADRAATAYYTQMNYLYMEMADKEDALQTAAAVAQQMKELLEVERTESEHTRQTMQAQISVLSNQLIEMADAAQAQQQQQQQQLQQLQRPR